MLGMDIYKKSLKAFPFLKLAQIGNRRRENKTRIRASLVVRRKGHNGPLLGIDIDPSLAHSR